LLNRVLRFLRHHFPPGYSPTRQCALYRHGGFTADILALIEQAQTTSIHQAAENRPSYRHHLGEDAGVPWLLAQRVAVRKHWLAIRFMNRIASQR